MKILWEIEKLLPFVKTADRLPTLETRLVCRDIHPELPYGRYKIKWLVEDGCTNEKTCEYNFEVNDCKAPTVVCINGLSTDIEATGSATLWASDLTIPKQLHSQCPAAVGNSKSRKCTSRLSIKYR